MLQRTSLLTPFFLLAWLPDTCAQPGVPTSYAWETDAEFRRDSALVVECLRWLSTRGDTFSETTWSELNAFVLTWLSNTPLVTVQLDDRVIPPLPDNEVLADQLYFAFVHGSSLFALEHPNAPDALEKHKAGIVSMAVLARAHKQFLRGAREVRRAVRAAKKDARLSKYGSARMGYVPLP